VSVEALLFKVLGEPIAKLLLQRWLGEAVASASDSVFDALASRIETLGDQRRAKALLQDLADRVVECLLPVFSEASGAADFNLAAVAHEVRITLEATATVELFLEQSLNPRRITDALHAGRPLPERQFSAAEIAFYARATAEIVRYLVATAQDLPKFATAFASENLKRLDDVRANQQSTLAEVAQIRHTIWALGPAARYESFEQDYRQAVVAALDYLELYGLELSREARRHRLSVAYIVLSLQLRAKHRDPAALPPPPATATALIAPTNHERPEPAGQFRGRSINSCRLAPAY
jgi:hypothetical protein